MFDLLILTARDRSQAWLFQQRLASLSLDRLAREVLVLPDAEGPQVGSGGSTLCALAVLRDRAGSRQRVARLRTAVVHCGGLSQRVPQFSNLGKAFAPAGEPDRLREEVLLETILKSLALLTAAFPPGVTIACGDALYRAGESAAYPTGAEAVAWAWPAPLRQASAHGVYLWDRLTGRAIEALQKPSPEELMERGCAETAPLDTGVLFLRPTVVNALLLPLVPHDEAPALGQVLRAGQRWRGLDLYRDLTAALCGSGSSFRVHPSSFRLHPSPFAPLLAPLRRFGLAILSPADGRFEHFGTTRELLDAYCPTGEARLVNSLVSDTARLGEGAVLQHCRLEAGAAAEIGADSFSLGLRSAAPLTIRAGSLSYQLPVRGAEAVVSLGTADNPKQAEALLGGSLEAWAKARRLTPDDLWGPRAELAGEETLWTARAFPVVEAAEVAEALRWLQNPGAPRPSGALASLAEIQLGFNARRWWRYENRLRVTVLARRLAAAVQSAPETSLEDLARELPPALAPQVLQELEGLARRDRAPLREARLWRLCATVAGERDVESLHHRSAFAAIQRGLTATAGSAGARRWAYPEGAGLTAVAPVRVDLAGGWTDTPPQACETGGRVLNMALELNGAPPVLARATVLPEREIRFRAADLRVELRCSSLAELRRYQDPGDPFALHKAALFEAGLIPRRLESSEALEAHLDAMGGGLLLETAVEVPKGSGLGTSSILGAAVLGALRRLAGRRAGWETLFHSVLRLEQRMTTGGGWQDQVGGLLPGIKLTETGPGLRQKPAVREVACSPEGLRALEERLVLFYTGVPRLARNVLQRVVDRYLAREPAAVETLTRMKALASELAGAIEREDWEQLGRGLTESWELNKLLEPSATNPELDNLFAAAAPHALGAKLAGAGGGGFMLLLARTPEDADALRTLLPATQPTGHVTPARIARRGLTISGA